MAAMNRTNDWSSVPIRDKKGWAMNQASERLRLGLTQSALSEEQPPRRHPTLRGMLFITRPFGTKAA